MFSDDVLTRAETVLERYRERGWMLATAESCTGGLIAACLTEIPGSSDVVERGFVAYSNRAKTEDLGVPDDLLRAHGAVSAEAARAMAEGALARSGADLAVSVTGIAGPGGGTAEKPVGLVHIAAARRGAETRAERHEFTGDRRRIRLAATEAALDLLLAEARAAAATRAGRPGP